MLLPKRASVTERTSTPPPGGSSGTLGQGVGDLAHALELVHFLFEALALLHELLHLIAQVFVPGLFVAQQRLDRALRQCRLRRTSKLRSVAGILHRASSLCRTKSLHRVGSLRRTRGLCRTRALVRARALRRARGL